MNKLFLIDGHALIFRTYYAFMRRPMINSKGEDTSILFGFTKYLLEILAKEKPTHLAVMFDPHAKTFRHELYPEYKGNRSAAPELVREAVEPLTEIVTALGIPVIMKPGFEADDVIGTLAKQWSAKGFEVYMVTPDKDLGQIIGENIFQYKPGKSGGDNEILGTEEICARFGITSPEQVIDILAIWGDAADNIKGVNGVGEVGAKKLVAKYGSVEAILNHTDELPQKQRDAFEQAREHLAVSKFLVTIKTDVPIETTESELRVKVSCNQCVSELISRYELNSLKKLLPESSEEVVEVSKETIHPRCVTTREIVKSVKQSHLASIRGEETVIISSGNDYAEFSPEEAVPVLTDNTIIKTGHNLKTTMQALMSHGINMEGEIYDIELMHYLLNPERAHKLDILASGYLNVDLDKSPDELKEEKKETIAFDLFSAPEEPVSRPVANPGKKARECIACGRIFGKIHKELEDQNLLDLYRKVEMPLTSILAEMEHDGVKIDPAQLEEYSRELSVRLNGIEAEARDIAQEPSLNLSSPRQVGIVIYEKLGLNPHAKKNRQDNYPTDEETLNELKEKSPFIEKLLEYRGLKKLISTYLDPLPSLIDRKDGRIHTTFNQALTATGRLSCSKPNLQNIPIRTEEGRQIRKAFVSGFADGIIVSADYSQIELRLMAQMSGDSTMIEAFRSGADIHTETAARIFHIPFEEVTKEQRRKAKVANFGIIYGISAFGLAQRMGISRTEAKTFIEEYFKHFPKVKEYMDKSIQNARENGWVETFMCRKRYLPDIKSRNQVVRSLAERNAINAPIQGGAADIIKLAMINVAARIKEEGLRSRMVLQVHDELVFDAPAEEREKLMAIVEQVMESAVEFSIPLKVECSYGKNWLEAH